MEKLVTFGNNHNQVFNQQSSNEEDALASITIDGYPEDENEEGRVVAVVWLTKHGDIIVDWHDNGYRMNANVLALIKESREKLQVYAKLKMTPADTVKVQAVWEFEADVEGVDPKFVDVRGLAIDSTQRELATLLEKKEISAEDFDYKIVD